MKSKLTSVLALVTVCLCLPVFAEQVVEDQGTGFSRQELMQLVKRWGRDMQIAAANNPDSRREILTLALAGKKIAGEADKVSEENDPDFFWDIELAVRGVKRQLVVQQYMNTLEMPDMAPLAKERFDANKDKYARVPERRSTSHILFRCQPNSDCDPKAMQATAASVYQQLQAGANFEELVQEYSQDMSTKPQGGRFQIAVKKGEARIPKEYTEAAFAIEQVGEYSPVIGTQLGLHIIRLDAIQKSYLKEYDEEMKQLVISQLEVEYRKLAAMEFDKRFGLSADAVFDDAVLDEIFAPYRTFDAAADAEIDVTAETEAPK